MQTYVERRLRFAQDQEAEERFVAILCRLHSLRLAGPDHWWRLGATITQAFKDLEHCVRERDWQMAWLWLAGPVPKPRPGMYRGLAQPLKHSAAIAYLREAHLLEAQRQAVAGRAAWPSTAETPARRTARAQRETGAAASGAGAAQAKRAARRRGAPKGGAAGDAGK